ncbi:hypothetical protein PAESOLCIP111_06357 [Paenibacillus solanacearum]|uniref:Aminoglycoside phosphotransferase domain-containing protein n=1 Tax=Paenibacillus solanacearum TaxID=2048548 RepID=A0A916K942_9BACL|nr:aminoglycoside phosphotransferase family protein [Paenibacillus solanacearum]CAG7651636.1 hypothetical protein PAESOLCIP111_06357 [Paenibacillus solanacearum]
MNLNQDELVALEITELTAVVQTMFGDVPVQVEVWQAKPLHGGTVGLVYEISGTCRRMCKAALTDGADESGRPSPVTVSDEQAELRWSVVLKIQKPFARFGDPESWQREMRLYRSDVYVALPPTVKVPRCYRVTVKRGAIWMWLEQVSGRNGTQLSLDEYSQAARHLAHLQGAFLTGKPLPSQPWLSTQYWLAHISADWGTRAIAWLDSGEWRQEDSQLSDETVREMRRLWAARDRLLDAYYTLPRTLCHRDFSAGNVFVMAQHVRDAKEVQRLGQTVVIDWDCAGIGIAGEDIADLVGEALVFYEFEPAQAAQLQETVLSSYVKGLREAGWNGDEQLIRLGYKISLTLHWCFRIAIRLRKQESREARHREAAALSFVAGQAAAVQSELAPDRRS